jgi:hypothetical protein
MCIPRLGALHARLEQVLERSHEDRGEAERWDPEHPLAGYLADPFDFDTLVKRAGEATVLSPVMKEVCVGLGARASSLHRPATVGAHAEDGAGSMIGSGPADGVRSHEVPAISGGKTDDVDAEIDVLLTGGQRNIGRYLAAGIRERKKKARPRPRPRWRPCAGSARSVGASAPHKGSQGAVRHGSGCTLSRHVTGGPS